MLHAIKRDQFNPMPRKYDLLAIFPRGDGHVATTLSQQPLAFETW